MAGPGEDTILGSNGADVLRGGDDNDFIDGQQGNDTVFGGAGNDTIQWDPGDGSDTVEGGDGTDTLLFNGSAGAEILEASANGARVRFTRNLGSVVMDLDDVEILTLNALGNTDQFTVNSLTGTDLTQVNVDLAGLIGGTTGDGVADTVVINGTTGDDVITATLPGGQLLVSGLAASVLVKNFETNMDRWSFRVWKAMMSSMPRLSGLAVRFSNSMEDWAMTSCWVAPVTTFFWAGTTMTC
jgi:Ca2+-binding RTX toxin-like protein